MKLTIELVPKTCWYSNVRAEVSKEEWDRLKKITSTKANYCCEICFGKGPKWPVECHEVWSYNDGVQKLERLIALCPSCHEVKHIGLAGIKGTQERALKHLAEVNKISYREAETYAQKAFEVWRGRSEQEWELDISYLEVLNEWSDG